MSGTRIYFNGELVPGGHAELSGDSARYLSRVLRLRPGDDITIFNGAGGEFAATIESGGKQSITVRIGDEHARDVESPLDIHLLQGVSRGERMDFVIQKATELGVARITPVLTEYSVVKLDESRARKRLSHWRGVAVSACEQSGRNRLPVIDAPVPLRHWLGEHLAPDAPRIVFCPGAVSSLRAVPADARSVAIMVGPEGGLSEEEIGLAMSAGFEPVQLGPRVLRTETAALAAITALQALLGDLT